MQAKALICDASQQFTIEDVTLPDLRAEDILVRTLYSGVSIGTEFALIRNKLSWGPYPLCTGYQSVGVVEQVGDQVSGFSIGARVYLRGHHRTMQLNRTGDMVSPVSGTHCSHVLVDTTVASHGAALLPEGVDPAVASLFVMPAVGLFGVDMANPRMGQTVVVFGVGPIGLGVVAACSHRGCRVIAVDVAASHLEVAKKLGADVLIDSTEGDPVAAVYDVAPEGADVVFECTGIPACVNQTIPMCKTNGTFVMQGNYGAAPFPFDFLPAHGRKLTMYFPCDDGWAPCRRAIMRNLANGVLPWHHTITHRVEAAEAAAFYHAVNTGTAGDVLGAVIHWS